MSDHINGPDPLNPAERAELALRLSGDLAALPNVERTPQQLIEWLQIDNTIVELIAMHQEAEERLSELIAPSTITEAAVQSIEEATLERETIAAEIQKYMQAEVAKVNGIARFRNFLNRMVDASKAEKGRAADRHKSWENRKASLDGFILSAMDVMGKTRVETAANRLRIQNNPESVEITDPSKIGDEFVEVELRIPLKEYKVVIKEFPEIFKRGPNRSQWPQSFKVSAIAAAIKETQKQPCEKCGGNGGVDKSPVTFDEPAQEPAEWHPCAPCLGTGFKRFPGARLVKGRHVRCE